MGKYHALTIQEQQQQILSLWSCVAFQVACSPQHKHWILAVVIIQPQWSPPLIFYLPVPLNSSWTSCISLVGSVSSKISKACQLEGAFLSPSLHLIVLMDAYSRHLSSQTYEFVSFAWHKNEADRIRWGDGDSLPPRERGKGLLEAW